MTAHRPLLLFAAANAVVLVVAGVGLVVDDRVVTDESTWAKPARFAFSFGLYGLTLSWMYGRLRRHRRLTWWLGTVVAVTLTVEIGIIAWQAARGVRSHFNVATPFDARFGIAMVVSVVVFWLATVVIACLLLRQGERERDPALSSALRLGFLLTVFGTALGALMFLPIAQAVDPAVSMLRGGHTVGAPDGDPGLPVTGWSSAGGDLRIPHFIGLHALQVVPLVAVLLRGRVTEWARLRLVRVTAAGFLGLVLLTLWQALRGQPLLAPDGVTLAAAGLLIGGVGAFVLRSVTRS